VQHVREKSTGGKDQSGKRDRRAFNVSLTRRRRTERCARPRARIKEPRIRQEATAETRGERQEED